MSRLTIRDNSTTHENGVCCTHFKSKECIEVSGNCSIGCEWEEEAWSKLAEYEDLEEQGLFIKWIPFKLREMDEEEKEHYGELGFQMLDCPLPDDDEEILITLKNGYVEQDTFLRDGVECYLDGGGEFGTEIIAWASKPKGYKEVGAKLKEMGE